MNLTSIRTRCRAAPWIALLLAGLVGRMGIAFADGEGLAITDYSLIQMQRLSRFEYELQYRAHVQNDGTADAKAVTATLATSNPATSIQDGQLSFGDIPAGSGKDSADSFTLHHDRRQRLDTSDWTWTLQTNGGNTNHNPQITSTPVTIATVGQAYSYDLDATDQDAGDTLTYSLTTSPTGMGIDANTGLITWTPIQGQIGNQSVTARVTDSHTGFATQSWTIAVQNTGTPISEAPSRANLIAANSFAAGEIQLTWLPSVDNDTPSNQIRYRIQAGSQENFLVDATTLVGEVTGVTDAT